MTSTVRGDPTLGELVEHYVARRPGWFGLDGQATVIDDEIVVPGHPGIRDVVAEVNGTLVHLPVGLRAPTEENKALGGAEETVLGLHEGAEGVSVAFDAVRDQETAARLLQAVTGTRIDPQRVRQVRFDTSSSTLAFDDALDFTIFDRLVDGPHPGLELLVGLDRAGFNHVAAPVAIWRRGGRDLGVVQEHIVGGSSGWAMARTSVRDLYASRVSPEEAGGDFASEANRLGTMTARMHLTLAEAFPRRDESVASIVSSIEDHLRATDPSLLAAPETARLIEELKSPASSVSGGTSAVVRAHGDFHLGRVWRGEQGWMVVELTPGEHPVNRPGGVPGDADLDVDVGPGPFERSPLGDVADMLWSFGSVASVAAARRDPAGRENLGPLGQQWSKRNREAFLAGYLDVPGIADLVPKSRQAVQLLVNLFEINRLAGLGSRHRES
ncbi:MAG: hypothetical protein WAM97_19470 [Acidimicrobiales bacterium]